MTDKTEALRLADAIEQFGGATAYQTAFLLRSQAKRIETLERALKQVIDNRDKNCDRPEEFIADRMGGYWSPIATMVDSEAIAAARNALEQSK